MLVYLANNQYIESEDVSLVLDFDTLDAKNYLNRAKEEGVYINIAGEVKEKGKLKKLRSVIILRNKTVLVSELRPVTIYKRLNNISTGDFEE